MKTSNSFLRKLLAPLCAALLPAFFAPSASAQTAPTAQTVPYTQNFGTATFTTAPAGVAVWNGLNGGSISSQALAEGSAPTGNATLTAATAAQTTGAAYGYAASGNAQLYIQTSSNNGNGVNQPVVAVDTTGRQNIVLSYDISVISAQPRTVGVVAQYRVGTTGTWTTITASSGSNPFSQAGGTTGLKTTVSATLPSAANNQSVVQIRWAIWRGTETGNSSGIGLDNISVSGDPVGTAPLIASFSPSSGLVGDTVTINGFNFGATPGVKFNGIAAFSSVNGSGTVITATVPSGATTGPITVEVAGEPTATSATDFTVLAPNTPIITLSTNTISGLSTSTGVASAATNYSVTGTNLGATPITVTPSSSLLEVGTNGTDFTNSLSLPAVGGVLSNNVFVRVAATNVVTNYSASISHVSGSASNSLAVSGAITNLPPGLVANPTNITGLNAATTNVPSAAQTYTLTGSNLTNDVTISAPAGFEVANDGATWGTTTSLTQTGGSVNGTISVRLAASSTFGSRSGNVTNISTGFTNRVSVSGSVPVPNVPGQVYWNFDTATPTSGTGGDYATWTFPAITQNNNNGTTALLNATSASSGYTNPFNVLASGTTNAGASARTGAFNAASNAFFEVQIVVPASTTTSVTNISFGSRPTGTGPAAFSIRSSVDGFATDLFTNAMVTNSWAMYVAPVAIALSNGTNTVRIYGYAGSGNASSNTANWRIDDLTLALAAGVGPTPTPPTITSTNAFSGTVGVAFSNDVTATGDAPIGFSGTALPGGLSVASGGAITGTPTAAGTFNATLTATNAAGTNNQAVTFTIATGAVSITTPPTASGLVEGQTLEDSLLSGGTASVPGTFAWTDSSIIPPVGTTSYGVTFTPTDAANYNTATTSVSVTVVSAYQAGYSSWLTEFQLDPATTGLPEADPDGDGFNNRSEYAFGTNPTVPNGALLSTTATNSVFRASWNGPAQGVTYSVLSTTNLSTTPFAIDPATLSEDAGIMSFTNSATGNKFFRVRATSP